MLTFGIVLFLHIVRAPEDVSNSKLFKDSFVFISKLISTGSLHAPSLYEFCEGKSFIAFGNDVRAHSLSLSLAKKRSLSTRWASLIVASSTKMGHWSSPLTTCFYRLWCAAIWDAQTSHVLQKKASVTYIALHGATFCCYFIVIVQFPQPFTVVVQNVWQGV